MACLPAAPRLPGHCRMVSRTCKAIFIVQARVPEESGSCALRLGKPVSRCASTVSWRANRLRSAKLSTVPN